jgi:glycosyltransferase involved in cell wall biosynthesis
VRERLRAVICQNVSLGEHLALSTYLRNLAKQLAQVEGVELHVIAQKGRSALRPLTFRLVEIEGDTYSIPGNVRFTMGAFGALRRIGEDGKIDLIHCLYPFSSLAAAALFKVAFSRGTKIVYDLRSPWIENSMKRLGLRDDDAPLLATAYRKTAYAAERLLTRLVDGYVVITKGLMDFYSDFIAIGRKPILILPSGVDNNLFRPVAASGTRERLGINPSDFLIGYVGALNRERNLGFLLRALRHLIDGEGGEERYLMLLVGSGDGREELKRLSRELGVEDRVIFMGNVQHEEVPGFLAALDAAVCHLPDDLSFRYSFPMKILEYAACGIPVFASRIPAHEEISRRLPVILYDAHEPSDLAEKIRSAPVIRPDPCKVESFSWPRLASELVSFMSKLCGKEGACRS